MFAYQKKILSISWQNMLLRTKSTMAATLKGSFWQVYVLFRKVNLCCAVYQSNNKLQLGQTNKEKSINHVFHQPCNIKYQPKEFHIFATKSNENGTGLARGISHQLALMIHQCNCFVSTGLVWWLPLTLYTTSKTIKR